VDIKNLAINHFEEHNVMPRARYRRSLIGPEGPTFMHLDKILRGMDCTWHDFADAYAGIIAKGGTFPSVKELLPKKSSGTHARAAPSSHKKTGSS
jgi:hypothetical protein